MTVNDTEIGTEELLSKIVLRIREADKEYCRQNKSDADKFLKDPFAAAEKSLADRYRLVNFLLVENLPKWKQDTIKEEPNHRIAQELARETARIAEDENWTELIDKLVE